MISRRTLEVATAALTGTFGVAVAVSSLELGVKWTASGVDPGTLPFVTGLVIIGGSLFNLVSGAFSGREAVVDADNVRRISGLFLPALAYIAAIPLLGMYVASAAYIFGVLALQHRMAVGRALLIAAIVVLALYGLFKSTFHVFLPRGWLGDWLGFYAMENNLDWLLHGFAIAASPHHLFLMVLGVMLGILVGVLPGLGAPNGVSLLLPLTFGMDPVSAIILLSCMYWGALFGGSVTSILFNIPGEPSSVATTFDGYPMARDGHPTTALTYAFGSAAFGALAGVVLITVLASWVAKAALAFGSPEFFAVYLLAFASFIGMGGAPPIKTLVALAIGFAVAAIGIDTVSGAVRLTMGVDELVKGVSFVVAVMGLFGIGELLIAVEEEIKVRSISSKVDWREVLRTLKKLPGHWWVLLRSAAVGCWMGITPGGPTAASFMSYGLAKRLSPRSRFFGKGEPDGIIAPEAADHSAGTSALLPMLALGVPGSATAAVMMGGLMIWGLNPGPMLFVEKPDFVWGLIASMYMGNIVAVILVLLTVPIFAALMRVPFFMLAPLIFIVCTVGAYSVSNSYLDVMLMMGFGVIGYLFKRLSYPLAPLVLAIVIGDKAEDAFRQSMLMSKGSLGIFFGGTLVTTLVLLSAALLIVPLLLQMRGRSAANQP